MIESDVYSSARVTDALSEISRLLELEADWDLDGARRIDEVATQVASRLVRSAAEIAWQEGKLWQAPEVGPVPDGSVALTWEGRDRQTLVICRPGQTVTVECVTREEATGPVRHVVSEAEAVRLALWALGDR